MKRQNISLAGILLSVVIILSSISCTSGKSGKAFLTEALDDSAWKVSEWISAADAPVLSGKVERDALSAEGASWFLSTVTNGKRVASARWMTTGLGIYDLYVNGKLVGKEVMKPGFTHYAKTKYSFTYDVTDALDLRKGASNDFSAQVTHGWWSDRIITRNADHGMTGDKCAFRGVLELTFSDGSRQLYGTDTEHWKAGIAGPVKQSGIYDGEVYDARELPGYATPELLGKPEINTEFAGEILPTDGAEIYMRHDLELTPVKAYVWEGVEGKTEDAYGTVIVKREYAPGETITLHPGENLVVDFGQNCSAVPSFVFRAEEGTQLVCLPGEILNDGNGALSRRMDGPEGSVHRENLRIHEKCIRLIYTFGKSSGSSEYCPRCTFFGYRFVSITATGDVTFESITSIPVTSISKELETGTITTGNELINKLISNSRWGQLSNYLSVPTDCPQRNERLGWLADTQVFTEAGTFFADTDRFFHKWMRDVRDGQFMTGAYPSVAPFGRCGCDSTGCMRVGWADAGIIVPWTIWRQYGDNSIVDECWESMDRFMEHVNNTGYDHETLKEENGNFQCADWLSFEALESNSRRGLVIDAKGKRSPLPETLEYWNFLSASYWASDARMMKEMAAATGRDASRYEAMEAAATAYLKDNFLNDKGEFNTSVLNTMQTPALFALRNGLVEGTAKKNMVNRLRANFAGHGNCLQTGFLGTSILMGTLSDNGMSDIAYEVLLQRRNPSWLYSIDNGATTIWERWDGYTIERGLGPKSMNSFNHYAYGAVCAWIWETVAGIAADSSMPGFRHIIMKPVPDRRLSPVEAVFNSAAGQIKSSWRFEGDTWKWDFTIPQGASASVTLPGETEPKEYPSGSYSVSAAVGM